MDAIAQRPSALRGNHSRSSNMGPRNRSRVACQSCNRRKVRCDVTLTGIPCSNCQHEGGGCQVLPRKKHRPRRTQASLSAARSTAQDTEPAHSGATHNRSARQSVAAEQRRIDGDATSLTHGHLTPVTEPRQPVSPRSTGAGAGSYNALVDGTLEGDSILPDDSSFSYIGDKRGPRQSVYDLCHPGAPQEARPYMPQGTHSIPHKPHEIEYMRLQGAFLELPSDVCDELIRCYFQHVHFFLPIIDAPGFLNAYISDGPQNISRLLLWSMFLAAANFADADVLRTSGFTSRKAMKSAMYERAKCLYDLDRGTDKLILIQSVILLGFWYTDPQDHTGAWYWTGIAICLSQSIGLHRLPRLNGRAPPASQARQSLMRRIWWTCVIRDRWVSLAKGRPMRIHSEDCDASMPAPSDILDELEAVALLAREKFIPRDSEVLASMWIRLVKISDTLGGILRLHYRANGPAPSIVDLDRYAEELRNCANGDIPASDGNEMLCIHKYQIELFYQATVTILYRPYVLNDSASLPLGASESWRKAISREAHEAASSTNSLLESLIQFSAIKYLKQMIITALIPAMQIHLSDCKSPNPLISALGFNKLQLCMLVLSNLKETYWSAGVMYRLFERAQKILSRPVLNDSTNALVATPSITEVNLNQSGRSFVQDEVQRSGQQGQLNHESVPLPLGEQNPQQISEAAIPWFDTSPHFGSVDQLLSPGFSLSENTFQDFFPGYDSSIGYDSIAGTVANGVEDGIVYNM